MHDIGLTHVALAVRDARESASFYERYAGMRPVHERVDAGTGARVMWLSDARRACVIVVIERAAGGSLTGIAHLGVGCESREAVDALVERARAEGREVDGPRDGGYPVGYWAFITDPDGNNLELSFGQEIGMTLAGHGRDGAA